MGATGKSYTPKYRQEAPWSVQRRRRMQRSVGPCDDARVLLENERRAVVDACQRLLAEGLVVGTAGNVSIRATSPDRNGDDLVVISPSGVRYGDLTPDLVGIHTLDGAPLDAPLAPSSELALHLAVYAGGPARAIVHTHAPASSAMSSIVETVPATHYYCAMFGGPIRVAPYARFGTPKLAEHVRSALTDRSAALMANHGAVVTADTLEVAMDRVPYVEYLCDIALRALATGQPLQVLGDAQLAAVGDALRGYGQAVPRPSRPAGPTKR